jgi:hypothetical protein
VERASHYNKRFVYRAGAGVRLQNRSCALLIRETGTKDAVTMEALRARLRNIFAMLLAATARLDSAVRDHTRKTISYLRDNRVWLWESRFFWLTVMGAAGFPAAVLAWWPYEQVIRSAGLGLQLAGIGTVWWGIQETRNLFDHPTFLMQARAWLRRRPKYGGRSVAVGLSTGAVAISSGRAAVWSHASADATLEQRIGMLEKNLLRVRDDLGGFQTKTEEDIRRQEQAMKQEQQARESADQEIREKLKATETGGLYISAMGALWLLVGVTMGTIPAELSGVFGQ